MKDLKSIHKADIKKHVNICSRCHREVEDKEELQSGEDYCFGEICQGCWQYFHSEEYIYDLRDREGESRYEQREGK